MLLIINDYLEVQDFFFHTGSYPFLNELFSFFLVNPEIKGFTQFSAGH